MPKDKLLIPGPVEVDFEVLEAMGSQVKPHYGPDWTREYNETLEMLRAVFGTRGDIFLMAGSGTVSIDACLGSAFASGDTILVGENGFFGERMISIAQGYGLNVIPVKAEWGKPLQPGDFEKAYRQHPEARGAAVVHLETSTTVLNPVDTIGPVIRDHNGLFFVDAVSSLGSLEFRMDDWCIDLCASATQKCLGAPPGLAPTAVNQRSWEAIDARPNKGHGWYGDLGVWRWYAKNWGDWHPTPVTMPTNNVYALRVGLQHLMEEGITSRIERYRQLAMHLRNGLRKLGWQPFTSDEDMSAVLTAALCPPGIESGPVVAYLAEKYHIKISGGLGVLKPRMIRVGTMSPITTLEDIDQLLAALASYKPG